MLTDTKNQIFLYFCSMVIRVPKSLVLCFDGSYPFNEIYLYEGEPLANISIFEVLFAQELFGFKDFPDPSLRLS